MNFPAFLGNGCFYPICVRQAGQTRVSSRINKPIKKSGKQNISIKTKTIQPPLEIFDLIIGGAFVPQRGQ
jgi:hypothetical protein